MEATSLAERAARVGDGLGKERLGRERRRTRRRENLRERPRTMFMQRRRRQRWRDESTPRRAGLDAGRVSPSGLLKREDLLSILERRAEAAGEGARARHKTNAWSWAWWATPTSARARR